MLKVEQGEIYFNQENTPISAQFDDVYFSNQDGLAESRYVFQQGNQLWQRWQSFQSSHFVIAETGFGTGLNFFAVTNLFREFRQQYPNSPLTQLFFISFEKYPLSKNALMRAHQVYPEFSDLALQLQEMWLEPIMGCYRFHFAETCLDLWFGDIAETLPQLGDYMCDKIDAWFLDGFSPSKNPQMWTDFLYQQMYRYTKPEGTFATFTAASEVRKGLINVGFEVKKRKGFGKKRECLQGLKPISEKTYFHFPYYLPQHAHFQECADVAIIGGGIASLFTALSLLERGAKVTLYCEDEYLAQNASGNKQGAFYPQLSDDDLRHIRFYIYAFAYGQQRLAQCIQNGVEFEYDFCGVALCAYDNKSASKLGKIAECGWHRSLYQPLSVNELADKVGLSLKCAGGFIPQGGWLAPQQFVQNTFAYLYKKGLVVKTKQKIVSLDKQNKSWILTNNQQQNFEHQIVVLANGHKLTQFQQTEKLPLYAVRGQVSEIPTSTHLQRLKAVLCYDGYLTPMALSQTHCIGASHLRDNQEREFSLQEQLENQQKIQQNIAMDWTKEVDVSSNQGRVGIRCSVRDRIPMLGNVPDFEQQIIDYKNLYNLRRRKQPIVPAAVFENLFLIGALGSRGLTSAPLLGETLASLIYNQPLPLGEDVLQALNPNRSWLRKLLKGSNVT